MSGFTNSGVENYWPQDTDSIIYIESRDDFEIYELIDACKEKWPNTDFSTLFIRAQKIHTSCLTYDLHDDSDWTNFIVVEKKT